MEAYFSIVGPRFIIQITPSTAVILFPNLNQEEIDRVYSKFRLLGPIKPITRRDVEFFHNLIPKITNGDLIYNFDRPATMVKIDLSQEELHKVVDCLKAHISKFSSTCRGTEDAVKGLERLL